LRRSPPSSADGMVFDALSASHVSPIDPSDPLRGAIVARDCAPQGGVAKSGVLRLKCSSSLCWFVALNIFACLYQEKASVLQAAKDISSILVGERAKRHTKLGDPNARAALALAINPVRPHLSNGAQYPSTRAAGFSSLEARRAC